jgi:hypothetical protein
MKPAPRPRSVGGKNFKLCLKLFCKNCTDDGRREEQLQLGRKLHRGLPPSQSALISVF